MYKTEAIADDADIDLFCTMAKAHHCIHSLLLPANVHTTSDLKDIYMNCHGVTQRCIKSHLYLVASLGIMFHSVYLFQQNTMSKTISDSRTGQQGTRVH